MKKSIFLIILLATTIYNVNAQVASRIIVTQSVPTDSIVDNFTYIDNRVVPFNQMNRWRVGKIDSIKLKSYQITKALGYAPYNATNPSNYITTTGARTAISLTTAGSGAATYNSTTGVLNVPTWSSYAAGTGISIASNTIANTAPDQTVAITGANGIQIGGLYPNFSITQKKQETFTGTTNASGLYSGTYGTAYSVVPNVQFNINGGAVTNTVRLTASTTTGFTILVQNRVDVIGLLPAYTNVTGAVVDVLVTEK